MITVVTVTPNQQHSRAPKIKVDFVLIHMHISTDTFSAKTTIVASILQDEKEEKDSYKAGSYTVCKPSALKKYLKATGQNLTRHLPHQKHSDHCDFQIMDTQKK